MTEEKIWEGELIENRVVFWDKDAIELYDESGYGKPQPEEEPNRVELDLVEAVYLLEKAKIKVHKKEDDKKKKIDFQDLYDYSVKSVNQFQSQYTVFRDLRERGYLVKTGYIFGSHFRVYERGVKLKRGPKQAHEHTKFVVHTVPEEAAFSLPEMSRAVRLAHNIRATFVWAVVDREGKCTYYIIQRLTP